MHWPLLRVAVSGPSMAPTLLPGDYLVVRRARRARPGDVVVVRQPRPPELLLVKRVTRVLDDGRLWVQGDNPYAGAAADDSRAFGPVPGDHLVGRVLWRYWPPRRGLTAT